jgi:hypothetical protein
VPGNDENTDSVEIRPIREGGLPGAERVSDLTVCGRPSQRTTPWIPSARVSWADRPATRRTTSRTGAISLVSQGQRGRNRDGNLVVGPNSGIGHELGHILLDYDVKEIDQLAGHTFITCNPEPGKKPHGSPAASCSPAPSCSARPTPAPAPKPSPPSTRSATTWPDSASTPAGCCSKLAAHAKPEIPDRARPPVRPISIAWCGRGSAALLRIIRDVPSAPSSMPSRACPLEVEIAHRADPIVVECRCGATPRGSGEPKWGLTATVVQPNPATPSLTLPGQTAHPAPSAITQLPCEVD